MVFLVLKGLSWLSSSFFFNTCFIIHSKYFFSLKASSIMLTSIDFQFIFDSACLSASLGDKGLFSSANILQIADAVRRVVFLLFLLCF